MRIFLSEGLFLPAGFLITVVLTRKLGPQDFGLFTLATVIVIWFESAITSLFGRASVTLLSQEDDWRDVARLLVRAGFSVSVIVACGLWFLASTVGDLLGEPRLSSTLAWFAIDIPIYVLARLCRAIMTGIGQFRMHGAVSAVYWGGRLVFIVALVQMGYGVPGAVVGTVLSSAVELAISMVYLRISCLGPSEYSIGKLWRESSPLMLFGIVQNSRYISALTILKFLGGTTEQIGYYGGMQNLVRLPTLAISALSSTFLATLRRIIVEEEDTSRAHHLGRQALRFIVLLLPYTGLVVGALGGIISAMFGDEYLPAAPIGIWLAFSIVPMGLVNINTVIMIAAGKIRWPVAATAPVLVATIAGYLYMVPINGPLGAAQVSTVSLVGTAIVTTIMVYRLWGVFPPIGSAVRGLFICVLAYLTSTEWITTGVMVFVELGTITIGIVVSYLVCGEFSKREIKFVTSLISGLSVRERRH